jgi:hypothetical protein
MGDDSRERELLILGFHIRGQAILRKTLCTASGKLVQNCVILR